MRDEQEEWRPVTGFEGLYDISSLGRIRSWRNKRGNFVSIPHLFSPPTPSEGYDSATLRRDGKPYYFRVHILVLETFVGPCPAGMEGCHWDGVKHNNRLENLRWDTRGANMADAIRHGTKKGKGAPKGEKNGQAILTESAVRSIRGAPRRHGIRLALAKRFGVTVHAINSIRSGRNWAHVS